MATQSFTPFPLLPTEIRLKIWQLALPPPRIIEIHSSLSTPTSHLSFKTVPCDCPANCDFYPSIAAANIESRSLFLSKFAFCFGTHICWKQDTIYIPEFDLQPSLRIQRLRVARPRDFLVVVKAFTDTILGTRAGEDLTSLALGVTTRWWPTWYDSNHNEDDDQPDYGSPASVFAPFTNIKELLIVDGKVGFDEMDPNQRRRMFNAQPESIIDGGYKAPQPSHTSSHLPIATIHYDNLVNPTRYTCQQSSSLNQNQTSEPMGDSTPSESFDSSDSAQFEQQVLVEDKIEPIAVIGKLTPYPSTPFLRPDTETQTVRHKNFYRPYTGGIQFVEAENIRGTVFDLKPRFGPKEFVDQMLEDEKKGRVKTRAGIPPTRVVALKVYTDSCFTGGPNGVSDGNSLSKIVFQKNLGSTS